MKKILTLIVVLLLAKIGTAQDPGIRDTVNFGECQSYIVAEGDSFTGKVRVPLRIFNDEDLSGLVICLKWSGPLSFDTLFFFGTKADSFDFLGYGFSNDERLLSISGFNNHPKVVPSDSGVFLFMLYQIYDTGAVKIDTKFTASPECPLWFVSPQSPEQGFRPQFEAGECQLVKSDTIPGDINGSNRTDLVDIIILVNFTFKSIYQGFLKPAADVNSDCVINLTDIIYLVIYIYKF